MRNRLKHLLPTSLSGVPLVLGYGLLGLVMVVLGLFLFFPGDSLQQRLEAELAGRFDGSVSLQSIELSLPLTLTAKEVRVRMNDRSIPTVAFDSVAISPHLATLFGSPGVFFVARSGNGRISGSLKQHGPAEIEIDNYQFDQPIQDLSELRIRGVIRSARFETELPTAPDSPTTGTLEAGSLTISGLDKAGFSASQLALGELEISLSGRGRRIDFERATLSGGDIRADLNGSLSIGRSLPATRLNLALQLEPTAGLDQSLGSLLELIGRAGPNNSRSLSISGSLARPNIR